MAEINANILYDITFFIGFLSITARYFQVRRYLEAYTKSRGLKPGSDGYNNVARVTGNPALTILTALTLLMGIKLGFDIRTLISSNESYRYGFLIFGTIGIVLLYSVVLYVAVNVFGMSLSLEKRPELHKNKTDDRKVK